MKLMKSALIVVFAFTLVFMAACSSGGDGKGNNNSNKTNIETTKPAENEEKPSNTAETKVEEEPAFNMNGETIKIAAWYDAGPKAGTLYGDKMIEKQKEVEKKYNVKIEYVNIPYGDILNKFTTTALSGEPMADLVRLELFWTFPNLVKSDFLLPLDEYIDSNESMWPKMMGSWGKYDDKQYLFTEQSLTAGGLFYNKTMFERDGLEDPYELQESGEWTWDKFLEIAMKATKDTDNDGAIDQWGITANAPELAQFILFSNNGAINSEVDGLMKYTLDSPESIEGLQYFYDLVNVHKVVKPNTTGAWDDFNISFSGGQAAMVTSMIWGADYFNENMTDEFGFVFFPKGPKTTDYVVPTPFANMWAIPKSAKHPEESIQIWKELQLWEDLDDMYRESLEGKLTSKEDVETAMVMREKAAYVSHGSYPGLSPLWESVVKKIYDGEETPNTSAERIKQEAQAAIDSALK